MSAFTVTCRLFFVKIFLMAFKYLIDQRVLRCSDIYKNVFKIGQILIRNS